MVIIVLNCVCLGDLVVVLSGVMLLGMLRDCVYMVKVFVWLSVCEV